MLDKDQIITVANIPDYVYTEDTDSEDVYKDLGKSVCTELSEDKKDGYDWTVFVNGKEWSGKDDEKIVLPESKNSDTTATLPTGLSPRSTSTTLTRLSLLLRSTTTSARSPR